MKKSISNLFTGLLLITLLAVAVASFTGWNVYGVIGCLALASLFMPEINGVAAMSITKKQLVVTELLEQFDNMKDAFMDEIRSVNEAVNNDSIRFTDIGADPDVLIDNTVYPIPTTDREDEEKIVLLRKLETTNTRITDDELNALYYDKKSSVRERHGISLFKKYRDLSLYSLAPQTNDDLNPVIKTTGAVSGNRRRLTIEDLIALRERCVLLNIDINEFVLNLCPEHTTDLLLTDQVFKEQYHIIQSGKILPLYGFKITENNSKNMYHHGTLQKLAWDAEATANHRNASTLICSKNAVKARGSAKMYYRDSSTDPENRESVVGFRLYGICIPKKNVGFGAVVSASNA
jgi:hypothetical protein